MSLKESILNVSDRAREAVDVSEFWPEVGNLYVQVMSGRDRDQYEWKMQESFKAKGDVVAPLLVRCLTDENGQRIFEDDDVSLLAQKNWRALDRLFDAARKINGMGLSNQKELAKN